MYIQLAMLYRVRDLVLHNYELKISVITLHELNYYELKINVIKITFIYNS